MSFLAMLPAYRFCSCLSLSVALLSSEMHYKKNSTYFANIYISWIIDLTPFSSHENMQEKYHVHLRHLR